MTNILFFKTFDKDENILLRFHLEPSKSLENNMSIVEYLNTNKQIKKVVTDNDRHSSYDVEVDLPLTGRMFITKNPSTKEIGGESEKRFLNESYEDYLQTRQKIDMHNLGWIYNIIEGRTEQQNIISNCPDYLLIKNFTWTNDNIKNMQLLGIVKDKNIMSLRDLTLEHVPLLKRIRTDALEQIERVYGIGQDKVNMFFHYPPSAYLLHIHFVHVDVQNHMTCVDKCHSLDRVIHNITLDTDYYRNDMRICVTITSKL